MTPATESSPAVSTPATPPPPAPRAAAEPGDWFTIRRVLQYIIPQRHRVFLALAIGMLASILTAGNLAALAPVLNVMLEEDRAGKAAGYREKLLELDRRLADAKGTVDRFNLRVERFEKSVKLQWTEWVMRERERAIYILAAVLVVAQVLKSMLEFLSKFMLQKSFFMALVKLRCDLYAKVMRLDLGQFQGLTSGDLLSRLNNDMRAVRQVFTTMVSDAVLAPFTMLALLVTMVIMNWQLTLVVFLGLPAILFPISYFGKKLRQMGRKDEEEDAKLLGYSQETIQGLLIVKAFGGERRETRKFRTLSREVAHRQVRREKYRLLSEPFVEVFASAAMAGVLCLGGYLVLKSDHASMSAAAFMTYLVMLTRFYPPVKMLSNTYVKMQKALASADRVFEIIDLRQQVLEKPDAAPLPTFSREIEFRDVGFSYRPDRDPVVENFSLVIPKGRKIAIVGGTGAGKTTVVRLLPRLYDVTSGAIFVDGVDVRDVTLSSLRAQVALVSQETILFNDTIANNIRYARPDATDEAVRAVAAAGYADEFIDQLPLGYETVVGERGGQLSGGQRQRIAIARALLADSPILVLDEATSALDNESEAIVQRAIDRLVENRTVIMIAHRLSTVRKADEIVVMQRGHVVERGTYDELVARGGRFYELLQAHELLEA